MTVKLIKVYEDGMAFLIDTAANQEYFIESRKASVRPTRASDSILASGQCPIAIVSPQASAVNLYNEMEFERLEDAVSLIKVATASAQIEALRREMKGASGYSRKVYEEQIRESEEEIRAVARERGMSIDSILQGIGFQVKDFSPQNEHIFMQSAHQQPGGLPVIVITDNLAYQFGTRRLMLDGDVMKYELQRPSPHNKPRK